MNDQQRFEELKRESVERFEEEYGAEARDLYGDDAVDDANDRFLKMSQETWDAKEDLEQAIKVELARMMSQGGVDPSCEDAVKLAHMHAEWIRMHWGEGYSPEAHRGLAKGYLRDPRFVAYYDGYAGEGATDLLNKIIQVNIR